MEIKNLGLEIKPEEVRRTFENRLQIHKYTISVGERGKKKLFLSNHEVRKSIGESGLGAGDYLGTIIVIINERKKTIAFLQYDPFDIKKRKVFEGKGIASLIEAFILSRLREKGFADYKIVHRNMSKERRDQLRKRHGRTIRNFEGISLKEELKRIGEHYRRRH